MTAIRHLCPIANSDGAIEIQIRDFDQTVIGNPAHDLIRLGVSLASAVRGSDLPGVTTAKMMEQLVEGYMAPFSARRRAGSDEPPAFVVEALREARRRSWRHFAKERLAGRTAQLPLGKRFWPLSEDERAAIRVAPRTPSTRIPVNNAERVVTGARAMSPYLGERMVAARLLGKAVFARELLPEDLKLELETLDADEATQSARFLAGVIGTAHARQMDAQTRKRWRAELSRNRTKSMDAPSWLWNSVVELLGTHERAYLEHCRRYAIEMAT